MHPICIFFFFDISISCFAWMKMCILGCTDLPFFHPLFGLLSLLPPFLFSSLCPSTCDLTWRRRANGNRQTTREGPTVGEETKPERKSWTVNRDGGRTGLHSERVSQRQKRELNARGDAWCELWIALRFNTDLNRAWAEGSAAREADGGQKVDRWRQERGRDDFRFAFLFNAARMFWYVYTERPHCADSRV